MGWTTIIAIDNDHLDILRNDPNFGENLVKAIGSSFREEGVTVPATDGLASCTGATIVTQFHRSNKPVVLVLSENRTIEID